MHKVLISACLLGEPVRYHGGDSRVEHGTLRRWQHEGRVVALCPEVAGGLGTPRPAAEIVQTADGRRVLTCAGQDVTDAFEAGAAAAVRLCADEGIRIAILKQSSPSCGSRTVYDGSFRGRPTEGRGLTAERLVAAGVQVFDESEIDAAAAYLESLG